MAWRALQMALIGVTCGLWIVRPVAGQDAFVREAYGNGVHAYYSGDLQEARQHFEDAIGAGARDPRCYYFRGLTYLKTGQRDAAETDFRIAATLESQGAGAYDVGRALVRVQGPQRLELERIRREVRSATREIPPDQQTQAPQANPPVRVPAGTVPDNAFAAPVDPTQLPDDPTDPFGDDAAPPEVTEAVTSTPPAAGNDSAAPADGGDDLFGDSVDNLFGDSSEDGSSDTGAADTGSADDLFSDTPSTAPSEPAGGASTGGAATAVFRSLFRAAGKALPTPELPGGLPMPGGGPPAGFPGDAMAPDADADAFFGDEESAEDVFSDDDEAADFFFGDEQPGAANGNEPPANATDANGFPMQGPGATVAPGGADAEMESDDAFDPFADDPGL